MDVVVALIAAGAGLAGAFLGGYLTHQSNRRLERDRQRREDQKDATFAKATARTLRMRYLTASKTLEGITEPHAQWWSGSLAVVRSPAPEELKILATYLNEAGWRAVESAEFLVSRWERIREESVDAGTWIQGVKKSDLEFATDEFEKAAKALVQLAHPNTVIHPIGRASNQVPNSPLEES